MLYLAVQIFKANLFKIFVEIFEKKNYIKIISKNHGKIIKIPILANSAFFIIFLSYFLQKKLYCFDNEGDLSRFFS